MVIARDKAGALDRRVTIEYPVEVQDGFGQLVPIWQVWAENVNARIEYQDAQKREDVGKMQTVSDGFVYVSIRYLTRDTVGVPVRPKPKMRLKLADDPSTILDIENVDEIQRRAGWRMRCLKRE